MRYRLTFIIVLFVVLGGLWYFTSYDVKEENPVSNLDETKEDIQTESASIYYIAFEGENAQGNKVGCNDTLVPVQTALDYGSDSLINSIEKLLAENRMTFEHDGIELYNSLYQSNLTLESAEILNNAAVISLKGELKLSGICDSPRVKAQIEETAMQFPGIQKVDISINGKVIDSVLSEQ